VKRQRFGDAETEEAAVALGDAAGTLAFGAIELEAEGAGLTLTAEAGVAEPTGVPLGVAELAGVGETDVPGTGVADATGAGVSPFVTSRVRLLELVPLCA
jgi:hypothetical protein